MFIVDHNGISNLFDYCDAFGGARLLQFRIKCKGGQTKINLMVGILGKINSKCLRDEFFTFFAFLCGFCSNFAGSNLKINNKQFYGTQRNKRSK